MVQVDGSVDPNKLRVNQTTRRLLQQYGRRTLFLSRDCREKMENQTNRTHAPKRHKHNKNSIRTAAKFTATDEANTNLL